MNTKHFIFLFITLNILDMLTTIYGLHIGLVERNPIGVYAMSLVGPIPAMLIMKTIGCMFVVFVVGRVEVYQRYHAYTHTIILSAFTIVVLSNIYHITNITTQP